MKTKHIPVPEDWKDLKPHPLSMLVPYGAGIDTVKLAEQMRQHGYDPSEPVVLFDGQILDGRHRHVAAQEADVIPTFMELVDGDLVAFVGKKLNRQHLNESQRAMFVAALINAGSQSKSATLPTSQEKAAEIAKVSTRTMTDATKVEEEASEEVKSHVMNGQVPVSQAADALRSVFCRNCRVRGPRKDCKDCQEKRREMGIVGLGSKPKRPKPPKIGAEKFDWKAFDHHYGYVARGPDDLKRAYGDAGEFEKCDNLLREFRKEWAAWRKRVLHSKE